MIPQEENFAEQIRQAGMAIKRAERMLSKAEAEEKREMSQQMVKGQTEGHKSAAAQTVFADGTDEMYNARLKRGVAKGALAAAKANLLAAETAVRVWQTNMSMYKLEARTYSYEPRPAN